MMRSVSVLRMSLKFNELKACSSTSFLLNPVSRVSNARSYSQFQPKSNVPSVILIHAKRESLLPSAALSGIMVKRCMSVQEVTKNLLFCTEQQRKIEVNPVTLRLRQESDDKPLVIIMSWLQSKQKHLSKYAQLYMDQGFDVLVTQITPWQLLWPVKGSQQVAYDLLKFMANNEYYRQMVVHGFSVGGYMWGECLSHMDRDRARYQAVADRIIGQIWDSAADISEIPIGVPKALFPRNPRLQTALRNYMLYHMRTFQEAATKHYVRSSQMFHTNFIHAPALFFVSKTDPVGAESSNRRVADTWIANGINVTWKCFDRSPHVGHFLKYREEYMQYLFDHLRGINMVKHPELLRAKL